MHRIEHIKILEDISWKLGNGALNAGLIEATQYTHPEDGHLWTVLSKKNRRDNWTEYDHATSYCIHRYNSQDGGLYHGRYDLTLSVATAIYEDARAKHSKERIHADES